MIAYNKIWLNNLFVQEEAGIACDENCITKEELDNINARHPAGFYTSNFFIRIGLFILTKIIMTFSLGLIALISLDAIEKTAGGLTIFFALLSFGALEYFIHEKKHFRSGVDDALLWGGAIALFCGACIPNNFDATGLCILAFFITAICTVRYADRLMAAVCFISFLGIVFFICSKAGSFAKAILPFVIMAISLTTYLIVKKINKREVFSVYAGCTLIIEIISLLILYTAGNYLIVRELSNTMFDLKLQPTQSLPFGFLFWIFTIIIPLIYLFLGIRKKDTVLLRVGLLLIAAIVFTVRYYYSIMAPEILMTISGTAMIIIAWALTRYLSVPKYGFTEQELSTRHVLDKMNIESLVIAQTFSQQTQQTGETKFGGGSFGGGGASGDF
ncbi:MAG: hypothetical protein QM737_04310 [Ferruginibacter sp.]